MGKAKSYHWEGEPGYKNNYLSRVTRRSITVFANVLKEFGLKRNNSYLHAHDY